MQVLQTPIQIALTAAFVATTGIALWRGGRPERWAALGVVLATLASPLVQYRADPNATQWAIMAVDTALLAQLAWLTWRWDKAWLIWASAFQLLTVVTHIGMALNVTLLGRAYIASSYLLFAGLLLALLFGSLQGRSIAPPRGA